MSLRSKILLILSVVVLLFAGIDHLVQRKLVLASFVRLERGEAIKDVRRVVQALEGEIRHLDRRCEDWATWDDTYRFAKQRHKDYIQSNLGPEGFHKNEINLLYICDTAGKVLWGRILDLTNDRPITLRALPGEALSLSHPLISAQERHAGIWMTEHGPMLVSSKPILNSRREGPSRGTVIMGRLLTDAYIADLQHRTGVGFRVWPIDGDKLPAADRAVLDEVTASADPVVRPVDDERLHAWTTFADTKQAPSLLIRADLAREITADGSRAAQYALISTVAAGCLILLVLLNLLQRTVLRPLAKVTQHAVEIGKNDETFRKLGLDREDEIGILSREFDRMMDKLSASRAAVVKAAHAAGMSEIATAVLHNVGNVLNSVNVSATLVAQKVGTSSAEDLRLAMKAVEESSGDLLSFLENDPRGEHLQPLLTSLAEQMASEQAAIKAEVASLAQGIEHIQELVRSQQSYAGRAGVLEATDPREPMETALSMVARPGEGRKPIEVERDFEDLSLCTIDRHRVTEILVNLVQNAREAMLEAPASRGLLKVRMRRPGLGRLRFEVEDDGVGIPPENLDRVFTHGFTTKKDGHGFGLHASANAAKEMGGSLAAHSVGAGHGATFVLELPAREIPRELAVGADA